MGELALFYFRKKLQEINIPYTKASSETKLINDEYYLLKLQTDKCKLKDYYTNEK